MKKVVSSILLMGSLAIADPIIMESGYVQAGVSDDGTFGVGNDTSPGILYDENGTGNYGVDDYLTPGTPWEFFSLEITGDTNVTYVNNNDYASSPEMDTTITGDAHSVTAISETPDGLLKIIQKYTLEEGSKILQIDVSVENISASTIDNVKYARGIDPDVDVIEYDKYETNNTRGYDGSAAGLPVFPVEDVVIAEGEQTKKIISLIYTGELPHNTNIDFDWGTLPSTILEGKDDGYGDNTINVAMDLGTMAPGDIKEFSFAYVLSDDRADLGDVTMRAETTTIAPPPPIASPAPLVDETYNRNDNPDTPQHGSAPAYNFGSILLMLLMFGFLSYRKISTKEARN